MIAIHNFSFMCIHILYNVYNSSVVLFLRIYPLFILYYYIEVYYTEIYYVIFKYIIIFKSIFEIYF